MAEIGRTRSVRKLASVVLGVVMLSTTLVVLGYSGSAQGALVDLGTLGGSKSWGSDINNLGQVVGRSHYAGDSGFAEGFVIDPIDSNLDLKPDVWNTNPDGVANPLMKDIGSLGGDWAEPIAINDQSQIAGSAGTSDGKIHGFLLTPEMAGDGSYVWNKDVDGVAGNDLMLDLGTFGGSNTMVSGINNLGMVVGRSETREGSLAPYSAFVWSPHVAQEKELVLTENQITTTETVWETMPRVGNDGTSPLVVFTNVEMLPGGGFAPGDISYQRLDTTGAPVGSPVQVTNSPQDDALNDIGGDYVVYSSYDAIGSYVGQVMVYRISTGEVWSIGSVQYLQEVRTNGDWVVWRDGAYGAAIVKLYNLDWLGTSEEAITIGGTPAFTLDVGDRYVVWSQQDLEGQFDIFAYDLASGLTSQITSTSDFQETEPSTSGPWIVWAGGKSVGLTTRIVAYNMDTMETRIVFEDAMGAFRPSIDGQMIAFETKATGNLDIFLYDLTDSSIWIVTTDPMNQYLNDVFGNMVAYLDLRNANGDIYLSSFAYEPAGYGPEMLNLGASKMIHSFASDINDQGAVIGGYTYYSDYGQLKQVPFLIVPDDSDSDGIPDVWNRDADNDGFNDLMTVLVIPGAEDIGLSSINNAGQIVGYYYDTSLGQSCAFKWESGVATVLGTLMTAYDNNDLGQIVGLGDRATGSNHAFLVDGSITMDLGFYAIPHSINCQTQVVGDTYVPGGTYHAFLWLGLEEPVPPEEQYDDIRDIIREYRADGIFNKGQMNSLLQKLDSSQHQWQEKDNPNAATNVIEALMNEIASFVSTGVLTEEQGSLLIGKATELAAAIQPP